MMNNLRCKSKLLGGEKMANPMKSRLGKAGDICLLYCGPGPGPGPYDPLLCVSHWVFVSDWGARPESLEYGPLTKVEKPSKSLFIYVS